MKFNPSVYAFIDSGCNYSLFGNLSFFMPVSLIQDLNVEFFVIQSQQT